MARKVMLPNQKRLKQLLHMLPHPPEVGIPPGVTDSDIGEFMQRTGVTLPSQFRQWLKIANGPYVDSRATFGIQTSTEYRDIEAIYHLLPVWKSKKWIPVASDGCGNYYVVPTDQEYGEGYPVVFVEVMQGSDKPAYIVASDVAHFLEFLMEDELKLAHAWPFDEAYVLRKDPEIAKFHDISFPWSAEE